MKNMIISIAIIVFVVVAVVAWLLFGSATSFKENKKYLYVYTGKADKASVLNFIEKNELLKNPAIFKLVANQMGVWKRLKPGRYEIKKGENVINITRMLRNNRQLPVNLVINKLRTNEDLAGIIGKNFEADSMQVTSFIDNKDSLAKLEVNNY